MRKSARQGGRGCHWFILAACVAVTLAWVQPAVASRSQESILQDDPRIVYADSDARADEVLGTLRSIGVDRVRVSVFWNLVTPIPGRDPASPRAYSPDTWDRFDRLVTVARKYGLGLLFTPTGPAPEGAAGAIASGYLVREPSPGSFRDFVTAVGRRYSGNWVDEQPSAPEFGGSATEPLPRVDHWSIWNEPNFPSWLSPLWRRMSRPGFARLLPVAPRLYRDLVDAAYSALVATGHRSDVILLGETAPLGRRKIGSAIEPLLFLRELYCLDMHYRPLRGIAARLRGCPTGAGARRAFARRHPGLFRATGFAHHPYSLERRPDATVAAPDSVPLGNIDRLTRALDRTLRAWGSHRRWRVWITEYGYQTAPDPYVGIPFERQAQWSTWAEYIAYRNPRVASMAQFLLTDDRPDTNFRSDDRRHWRTWQSGLLDSEGRPKPALAEYGAPLHVAPTRVRRGRRVTVFGIARAAAAGTPPIARIQAKAAGGDWTTLRELRPQNSRAYLETTVVPPASAELRILWVDPASGAEYPTRSARVVVR